MFDGDSNWKRKHNRYLMGILACLAWSGPNMYIYSMKGALLYHQSVRVERR